MGQSAAQEDGRNLTVGDAAKYLGEVDRLVAEIVTYLPQVAKETRIGLTNDLLVAANSGGEASALMAAAHLAVAAGEDRLDSFEADHPDYAAMPMGEGAAGQIKLEPRAQVALFLLRQLFPDRFIEVEQLLLQEATVPALEALPQVQEVPVSRTRGEWTAEDLQRQQQLLEHYPSIEAWLGDPGRQGRYLRRVDVAELLRGKKGPRETDVSDWAKEWQMEEGGTKGRKIAGDRAFYWTPDEATAFLRFVEKKHGSRLLVHFSQE